MALLSDAEIAERLGDGEWRARATRSCATASSPTSPRRWRSSTAWPTLAGGATTTRTSSSTAGTRSGLAHQPLRGRPDRGRLRARRADRRLLARGLAGRLAASVHLGWTGTGRMSTRPWSPSSPGADSSTGPARWGSARSSLGGAGRPRAARRAAGAADRDLADATCSRRSPTRSSPAARPTHRPRQRDPPAGDRRRRPAARRGRGRRAALYHHPLIGFDALEPAFLADLQARSLQQGGQFLDLGFDQRVPVCVEGLSFANPARASSGRPPRRCRSPPSARPR